MKQRFTNVDTVYSQALRFSFLVSKKLMGRFADGEAWKKSVDTSTQKNVLVPGIENLIYIDPLVSQAQWCEEIFSMVFSFLLAHERGEGLVGMLGEDEVDVFVKSAMGCVFTTERKELIRKFGEVRQRHSETYTPWALGRQLVDLSQKIVLDTSSLLPLVHQSWETYLRQLSDMEQGVFEKMKSMTQDNFLESPHAR